MIGRLTLLLVIALLGTACEPPPDVEPLPCRNLEPGMAELGKGDLSTGFTELSDGDDVHVVFGPQGMHMLTLSLRVWDMEPSQAGGVGNRVSVGIRHEGVVVGGVSNDMEPSAQQDEITEFLGIRSVFTAAEVDVLDEEMANIEVIVSDGCGRELSATRPLRLTL